MNRFITLTVGVIAAVATASGCGSSGTTAPSTASTGAPTTAAGSATAGGSTATVKTADTPLGPILVDGSGRTLYLFKADTGTISTCNGTCTQNWPPQTTTGTPQSSGVTASLVGTTTRSDNSTQVTYNGHPLYHFFKDTKPGETNGQGVNAFGASWYVVSPSGDAITSTASASASPSAGSTGGGGSY
ncbi:COG4315 family predicted lipoprotein [Kitasatospora griseola]|uniref:COG4315 family predicted lipoprotein n=1 Tax=Kitasatospora griseola TaxID=2064 RepID=UPI0037F41FD4